VLRAGAVSMSALFLPTSLVRPAHAATSGKVLVVVYQRGGQDGLQAVIPRGDPFYYSLRPTIQVPPGSELDLDPFFGLHPGYAPLKPLFDSGDLSFIHASGSPDPSRSHFDCQDFMERAAPGDKSVVDGWLSRYLVSEGNGDPLQGITVDKRKVKSIIGPAPSIAFNSIDDFALTGQFTTERRAALDARYQAAVGLTEGAARDALAALDTIAAVDQTTSVVYPGGGFSEALRNAAALIRAQIGVCVICVNIGGWDHHSDIDGRLTAVGGDFAASLAAFWADLGSRQSDTLALCMTEFGRRPAENGGGGSDHGHGGVMTVVGGGHSGGQVRLAGDQWPGLAPADLYNGQDLAVTTDFRDVFAEVLERHMGMSKPSAIFPSFTASSGNYPGLF
jgi:uncharacterized protein (DUF1501 family)